MALNQKRFLYKVYSFGASEWDVAQWDKDVWGGDLSLVTTWSEDVINEPAFRSVINVGASELQVRLARPYNDFGEGDDVQLGNVVELWIYDEDAPDGVKIFKGKITRYVPKIEEDKQWVDVTVLGLAFEFQDYILRDAEGNTTIAYNSEDPSDILVDVLTKYRADGGSVGFDAASINKTNTVVSYTFALVTIKEALDKILELSPDGWYGYVDATGTFQFHQSNDVADHKVAVGREVRKLSTEKTLEQVINRVYGVGGTPAGDVQLYKVSSRQSSIDAYGLHAEKLIDGRVTLSATMDTLTKRKLDRFEVPITRSVIEINDNNGPNNNLGDDIESYNVGDSIQVTNLRFGAVQDTKWDVAQWDEDVWDKPLRLTTADVLQILSIQYTLDRIVIEAADRLPEIAKRIEDINRNLEKEITKDIPVVPS